MPSFNPTSEKFLATTVGVSSSQLTVTLTNNGTTALDITNMVLAGTDPGDFEVSNGCASSLAPTDHCPIGVTFKPTKKGARSANLVVYDNAHSAKQAVPLSGSGK